MKHDLLIRGATIVDGTGAPSFVGDVAIRNGLISHVGQVGESAQRIIEGAGLTLTPGFVDIHTHYDGQASWDSVLAPSSLNGVTSVGMGNCGVGFAPAKQQWQGRLIALLEGVEDIPGTALAEGLTWDWETFPQYLDALERRSYMMDLGAHIPHAALRAYVMGDRGRDHCERPTDDEVAKLEQLTFEALQAGALGFSTSRTWTHKDRDGVSINTLTATQEELAAAARALKRAGKGVLQLVSDAYLTSDEHVVEAEFALMEALARESGRPLSFSLMQAQSAPFRYRKLLMRARELSAEGLTVKCQVAPRPVGVILGFSGSLHPFAETPTWSTLVALPLKERLARLRQPAVRVRLIREARSDGAPTQVAQLIRKFGCTFRMCDPVDYEQPEGNSIAAEASRLGVDVFEHVYDVLSEQDGRRLLYLPIFNYVYGNLDAVHEMLGDPLALFGLSDGGAHCGSICDASFPTTTLLWSRAVRPDRKVSIEWLVHGYTQRNSHHVGWLDRGVIAPGFKADINLIDLDRLALPPPVLIADLPAGGLRLMQRPRGYRYTLKSGEVTFEDGHWTGATPGRLLRGPQAVAA